MLDNLHAMDEDNRRAVLERLASPFKLRVTDGDNSGRPEALTIEQVQARMIELLTPMGAADRLIAISKLAEPFEGVEVTFNGGAYKIDTKARHGSKSKSKTEPKEQEKKNIARFAEAMAAQVRSGKKLMVKSAK